VWQEYRRYLKGLRIRGERAVVSPGRDREKGERIEELLAKVEAANNISGINTDADLHDLWVLSEECRLAVFAPEVPLKIRNPLSKIP